MAEAAQEWQHPFVNVFKLCGVEQQEQKRDAEISGKVAARMDDAIHKRVLRITGAIPAVNYLKLPKSRGFALHGRFCYLQVRFEQPSALFSIHLEAVAADGNTCRISIGNIFKAENIKKKAGCVQFTLKDPPACWMLLSVDLATAVAAAGSSASGGGNGSTQPSPYSHLKGLQLCSMLTVRGVFTSDIRFGLQTLPREMVLCHSLDASQLAQVWLPAEPVGEPEPPLNKPIRQKLLRSIGKAAAPAHSDAQPVKAADQAGATAAAASTAAAEAPAVAGALSAELSAFTLSSEPSVASTCHSFASRSSRRSSQHTIKRSTKPGPPAAATAAALPAAPLLQPEPYMAMHRVNGFTGEYARSVLYCAETDELVYPAGGVVVAMAAGNSSSSSSREATAGAAAMPAASAVNAAGSSGSSVSVQQLQQGIVRRPQGSQRFFVGHSAFVCCLALGGQGQLLATGQEGKAALIRVWDFGPGQQQLAADQESAEDNCAAGNSGTCLAVLCAHASRLAALDVSADGRALVAAGCDSQGRQVIALWDISGLRQSARAQLLVSHVSHHNIRVLRFSPFEPDTFLSAGRDSVRTYRLKAGSLRGISVRLEPPMNKSGLVVGTATAAVASGTKIFTDLGYEAGSTALQLPTQHVFAATASGAVFQIDYARRCVVAVYQLHVGAINSLAIGEGVAATASDDASLRLWPLDFRAYLLEAQHESPVTSVTLTAGGLGLAAGCEDGLLGLLGVVSRRYAALMRSHCGPVACVVPHHERPEYCTASADGSVRVWDVTSHQQLYEYGGSSSSRACGAPTAAAYHPLAYQLAIGYSSGWLRLFDVATTTLLLQQQQHKGPVTQLLFTPDGSRLLSCGADGKLVACDTSRQCTAVKALLPANMASGCDSSNVGQAQLPVCAAVSPDGRLVAVGGSTAGPEAGSGGATISLFAADSLEAVLCIETTAQGFVRLEFSPDSQDLWAVSSTTPSMQDDSSSGGTRCSVLRFCATSGSLLQVLPNPHGAAAVTAFAVDPARAVLATGGADHLVKVWAISSRKELAAAQAAQQQPLQRGKNAHKEQPAKQQQQQQAVGAMSELPAYQSFTGHSGAVTGAAFLGTQLLTVGEDGNIAVWNLHSNSSGSIEGDHSELHRQRMRHPDVNVTMRSWLERPAAAPSSNTLNPGWQPSAARPTSPTAGAGAAAAGAGGVRVPELQGLQQDPGIMPSSLFSAQCPYQQQLQLRGLSNGAAAGQPVLPVPVRCSWLLGLNASAHGSLLWLRQRGLVAHPTGTVLVLTDLASHKQRHLQHHSQPISAAAASSDGSLLATAPAGPEPVSGCAEVCVWDVVSCTLRYVLRQHASGVGLLAFSPDNCWLASVSSGGAGGLLVLWDLQAGEAGAIGKTQKAVSSIAWMPWQPLPTFLTSGEDGLLLWSLAPSFLEQRQLTVPDAAGAAFTAVCSAASSGCLPHSCMAGQPFDPAQQAARQAEEAANAFAADESGTIWQLAIGEGALLGCVVVARLAPGQVATQLQWSQPASALAVATSSGRLLRYECSMIISSSSTAFQQWWASDRVSATAVGCKQQLPQWQSSCDLLVFDGPVTALHLEPQQLSEGVAATAAATCWYVDVAQQQLAPLLAGHAGSITGLVDAGPDAPGSGGTACSGLVASMCEEGWLALWRMGGQPQALPLADFRSEHAVTAVAFQPGHSSCIVGYADGRLALLDLAPSAAAGTAAAGNDEAEEPSSSNNSLGVIRWSVVRHASPVLSMTLHPSQPLVMVASRDGLISVTNTESSRLVACCQDLTGSITPLHMLAVNPGATPAGAAHGDSNAGAAASSIAAAAWLDRVLVFSAPWQASSAQVLCSYQCPEVPQSLPTSRSSVAFIPGSSKLLLFISPCMQASALLFDIATGQPLRELLLPGCPSSIAVSPGGHLLAFGLQDGRVLLANAAGEASSELGSCAAGRVPVASLAFTAGGQRLLAAAGSTMTVWDA